MPGGHVDDAAPSTESLACGTQKESFMQPLPGSVIQAVSGIVFLGEFGTLGASVDYFTSGDMEETTIQQPDGTGRMFGTHDIALGSRTQTSHGSLQRRCHGEVVSVSLPGNSGSRGTDIGSVHDQLLNEMRLGIALQNRRLDEGGWSRSYCQP
jgi:hypothetical protein